MKALIVAADLKNGIGYEGSLAWDIKADLKYFREITKTPPKEGLQNVVIMGRKTYESIGRALPGRLNVVISRSDPVVADGVLVFQSIDDALAKVDGLEGLGDIYFIGGHGIYKEVMDRGLCDKLLITKVMCVYRCDVFFPEIDLEQYHLHHEDRTFCENGIYFKFQTYLKSNKEENQYLNLLKHVINLPNVRQTRNSTTKSDFHHTLRFDLRSGFPILTTKRVYWKGVVEELLWFIKGSTDSLELSSKGVRIWDGNTTREFLDSRGLTDYRVGTTGPFYGFQWRHYGAEYHGPDADYTGKGVDQLAECIRLIKEDPTSRRICMTAWNPEAIPKSVLPPCHSSFIQFYVDTASGVLHLSMYQRSADLFLGVPFNISSYALLLSMVARLTGLVPGELIMSFGDCHIYTEHFDAVKTQIARTPTKFPILAISDDGSIKTIDDFRPEHFKLVGYSPQASIKAPMIV
uniref:thymidylate synthase n=1 Tax=viral metagenome TaxID=1070528 RepID=A0A6C0CN64_9ZZZZ